MTRKLVVLGGTGFVGRVLAGRLAAMHHVEPHFIVHREVPAWLESGQLQVTQCRLDDTGRLAAVFGGTQAVLNLLRPDGSLDRLRALEGVLPLLASVPDIVHAGSIDVFGTAAATDIDEATPPEPDTPYAREHLAIEERFLTTLPQARIIRLGAVFGPGGRNVVAFAREAAEATQLRLAARRMLYGTRRMHLVSVEAVVACLADLLGGGAAAAPRLMLLTDDGDPRNNFGFMQDTLLAAFGRRPLRPLPSLSPWLLTGMLRVTGRPHRTVQRRFRPSFEPLEGRRPDFAACLRNYADILARGYRP